ncbi:MAG: NDP-hexose 4-ketoreductase, partial [Phycisphaeraceae bacterium]|nr:NDP-hexose 4-ketoreductase [Phycisphaeraceae bacterium]
RGGFGFAKNNEESDYHKIKQTLNSEIERYFRPEFINRLDDVIVFRQLSKADLVTIVEYELRKVHQRLEAQEMKLELEESAKEYLIEKGYNPDFGARPLRRALEQNVEDPVSEAILRGELRPGKMLKIRKAEDREALVFDVVDQPASTAKEETPKLAESGAEST